MISNFTTIRFFALVTYLVITCNFASASSLPVPPPPATEYYTLAPGGDMTTFIWSKSSHTGANCSCIPDNCSPFDIPSNTILYIAHPVSISCDIVIGSNATIIVESGGSLTVLGNGSVTGTGDFQVNAGGSVVVTGDLNLTGTGDITLNGSVTVGGDLTISGAATFCGGGTVSVTGVVTGIPDPCFTGVLPIELLYFNGKLNEQIVELKWATASEVNNDYFTVQRSANGNTWSNLMIVSGAGNSSSTIQYNQADYSPLSGTSYYKLKQTDYDGNSTESQIVVVQNNNSFGTDIIPFPNPNNGNVINLEVFGFDNTELQIKITDLLGSIIYNNIYPISGNNAQITLQLANKLPSGTYCITGSSQNGSISKKVLIN